MEIELTVELLHFAEHKIVSNLPMMKSKCIVIAILFHLFLSPALRADDFAKAFEALEKGDYKTASFYLSFFASNGDSVAQYNMGLLYRDGLGVEKNPKVALSWLYLAAQQRHMLSNFAIAKLLETYPYLANRKKGRLHFLKEAAFLGHAIAPLEIGNFYYLRQETDFDLVRAMVWWIVSSERNAPGSVEMISSVSPLLDHSQMNQVTLKLADCDSKTYRNCLDNF